MRRLIRVCAVCLKEFLLKIFFNIEINILGIPNFGNKLIQFRRMGGSTRHKWVNHYALEVLLITKILLTVNGNSIAAFKLNIEFKSHIIYENIT
jgi:hypothetical protein